MSTNLQHARRVASSLAALAALAFATPSAAQAACVADDRDPFRQVERAEVAFIGVMQPGPNQDGALLSPVQVAVEHRLDDGKAASEAAIGSTSRAADGSVVTDPEGLTFQSGERWMIVGDRRSDGSVTPGCGEATRQVDGTSPPTLRLGTAKVRGSWSDTRGRLFAKRPARTVRLPKPSVRAEGATAARLIRADRAIQLKRRGGVWPLTGARAGDRLVVANADGFWTVQLRR